MKIIGWANNSNSIMLPKCEPKSAAVVIIDLGNSYGVHKAFDENFSQFSRRQADTASIRPNKHKHNTHKNTHTHEPALNLKASDPPIFSAIHRSELSFNDSHQGETLNSSIEWHGARLWLWLLQFAWYECEICSHIKCARWISWQACPAMPSRIG